MSGTVPQYRKEVTRRRRAPAGPPIVLSALPDTLLVGALLTGVLALALCALFYGEYTVKSRLPVLLRQLPAGTGDFRAGAMPAYEATFTASAEQLAVVSAGKHVTLHLPSGAGSTTVEAVIGAPIAPQDDCAPAGSGARRSRAHLLFLPRDSALPREPTNVEAEIAGARRRLADWLFK